MKIKLKNWFEKLQFPKIKNKSVLNIVFNLQYLFCCLTLSSVFYIFFVSVLGKYGYVINNYILLIRLILFIFCLFLFKKYLYFSDLGSNFNLKKVNIVLLILSLIVVLYRFAIYFHAIDDYVLHMISGNYFNSFWYDKNFLPMSFFNYIYPLLQITFDSLISIFGIRLTNLFLSISQIIWILSLNVRFLSLFKNKIKMSFYLNLFFIILFFLPELIITNSCFMSDFYSVLFALESIYIFIKYKNFIYSFVFFILAIFSKQSSGLFLIPLFLYIYLSNFSIIKKTLFKVVVFSVALYTPYLLRCFFETGNPLAFLCNNFFKSPLYDLNNFRDLRWGPVGFFESLLWPFKISFTSRYMEFFTNFSLYRLFFSMFVVIPYLISFLFFLIKKNIKYLVYFLSIFLWSYLSGYSRYQIALIAVLWIFLLVDIEYYLPYIKGKFFSIFIIIVIGLYCFPTIKNDAALRGFILKDFFPPIIDQYFLNTYKNGLKFVGHDRYIDIFNSIKNNYNDVSSISVIGRGDCTYYAYLGNRFKKIPVYSILDIEKARSIIDSKKISLRLKNNVLETFNFNNTLLITDVENENLIKDSYIYQIMNCKKIERDKTTPQFQHANYFNYVVEYLCEKK